MTLTNVMGLPESIVRLCEVAPHNKPNSVSITTLLKGTREIILERRHWDEMTVDVSDRIWAIYGQIAHKLLEHETENTVAEEYLSAEIDGYKVTGRMDLYNLESHVIDDYKTASVWKIIKRDFEDWKLQGIGYGWLLYKNGFDAKRAQFTAILKDHKKSEAKYDRNYPQKPVYVVSFPITPADIYDFERFVTAKIAELKRCENLPDDELPICSAKERWEREAKWAVMKEGNKRAVKLCFTKDEAERFTESKPRDTLYIEERKGESIKCMEYCSCNSFCSYYKSLKADNGEGVE